MYVCMYIRHLCVCICVYICVCIKSGALSTTHVTSPAVAVAVNVLAHPTGSSSSRSRLFTPLHFTWLSLHSSLSLSCPLNTFVSFMACKLASAARAAGLRVCPCVCPQQQQLLCVRVCGPCSLCCPLPHSLPLLSQSVAH